MTLNKKPTSEAKATARELDNLGFEQSEAEVVTATGSRQALKHTLGSHSPLPEILADMEDGNTLVGEGMTGDSITVSRNDEDSFDLSTGTEAEEMAA